jgi:hypothetical protein
MRPSFLSTQLTVPEQHEELGYPTSIEKRNSRIEDTHKKQKTKNTQNKKTHTKIKYIDR